MNDQKGLIATVRLCPHRVLDTAEVEITGHLLGEVEAIF